MTRKEALEALLNKVEAGKAFPHDAHQRKRKVAEHECLGGYFQDNMAYGAFHGSLDAAKALHEAALPGWHYLIDSEGYSDGFGVRVFRHSVEEAEVGKDPSMARAWLIAILRALIAMDGMVDADSTRQ